MEPQDHGVVQGWGLNGPERRDLVVTAPHSHDRRIEAEGGEAYLSPRDLEEVRAARHRSTAAARGGVLLLAPSHDLLEVLKELYQHEPRHEGA